MTPAPRRYCYKVATVHVVREENIVGQRDVAKDANAAAALARKLIPDDDREHFCAMFVGAKNRMLSWYEAHTGGMSSAPVDSRTIYRAALLAGACGVIFFHNHPSGDTTPSEEDRTVTRMLVLAGQAIGITVLDHVIVGPENDGYYSFAEHGQI